MLKSKEKISIWKKPTEKADKFPGAGRERETERLTGSTLLPFFVHRTKKVFLLLVEKEVTMSSRCVYGTGFMRF